MVRRRTARFVSGWLAGLATLCLTFPAAQADEDRVASVPATDSASAASQLTLEQAGRELSRIAKRVSGAVVHIQSSRARTEETGSGVLMRNASNGTLFIVTNRHVITGTPRQSIDVHLADGQFIHPDSVLEDPLTDLAILKVDCKDPQTADWGNSDELEIGHFVLAVGSPFGLSQSVTLGIISAKSRRSLQLGAEQDIVNQDFLQTDAAINPGNSGGPLIDLHGRVVGINTAIASQGGGNEGIGFSIPSNLVRFVVDELLSKGEVKRGYLGVELDDHFDDAAAQKYHLERRRGARIVRVLGNSPAEIAGLRVDDVILSINGESVEDENHLINRVSLTPVNSKVEITVLRSGRSIPVEVVLKERPPKPRQTFNEPPERPAILPAGLELAALTDGLAVQAGQQVGARGLLVLQSPSRRSAELRLYDVIVEAARTPVHTVDELETAIRDRAERGPVLLKVLRAEHGGTTERLVLWSPG